MEKGNWWWWWWSGKLGFWKLNNEEFFEFDEMTKLGVCKSWGCCCWWWRRSCCCCFSSSCWFACWMMEVLLILEEAIKVELFCFSFFFFLLLLMMKMNPLKISWVITPLMATPSFSSLNQLFFFVFEVSLILILISHIFGWFIREKKKRGNEVIRRERDDQSVMERERENGLNWMKIKQEG